MVVAESLKIAVGTWFFARSIVKAAEEYFKSDKKDDPPPPPKGINLNQIVSKDIPSVIEIKKVIPKHCFDPKVSTSMYYALKDVLLVTLTFVGFWYIHQVVPHWAWYPTMFLYWCFQGTLFTAFFVIGHDCGHDSFSHHGWLNDTVGTVYHGFLLCPYYMWKLTHRVHHKNNANFDKDEVFYPTKESDPNAHGSVLPGFGFGVGWFGYLFLGYKPRNVPHFDIKQKPFQGHEFGTISSLVAVISMASVVAYWISNFGALAVFNYYGVPLFIFASYTVIITFLHHSEVNIPWYADSEWNFIRGQLSTVDRHYGVVHKVIHSIGTHQIHHMFTKVPHYHLEEATVHFRHHFPELVRVCHEPILPSFMRMFRKYIQQGHMSDDCTVHVYK